MTKPPITPASIDALLPQTQCELCGYPGCLPYATALANKAAPIDLCPPGGVPGLLALAEHLNQDPTPYLQSMAEKTKPPLTVVIREAECIGCTKCITACPVDAILGAAKQMHTVLQSECTGCERCIAPCPVDCIDIIPLPSPQTTSKDHYRQRYLAKKIRIENREKRLRLKKGQPESGLLLTEKKQDAALPFTKKEQEFGLLLTQKEQKNISHSEQRTQEITVHTATIDDKKNYLQAALERAKNKAKQAT